MGFLVSSSVTAAGLGHAGPLFAATLDEQALLLQSFLAEQAVPTLLSGDTAAAAAAIHAVPGHAGVERRAGIALGPAEAPEAYLRELGARDEYARGLVRDREVLGGVLDRLTAQGVTIPEGVRALTTEPAWRPAGAPEHRPAAVASLYAPQTGEADQAALYAQPLSHATLVEVERLRSTLEAARPAVGGLAGASGADATQAGAIEAVWLSLARLDRLLDVSGVTGGSRSHEIRGLVGAAEQFLADLGLNPMSQEALQMRERQFRAFLIAPGQADEYVELFQRLYQRSPAARRFIDEVVTPALQGFVDVRAILRLTPAEIAARQNKEWLNSSRISQPMVLASQLAMLEELKTYGFDPRLFTAASGHSQGLILASVAAGMITPAAALRKVAVHGREMENATDPAHREMPMISVLGLSRTELVSLSRAITLHLALLRGVPGELAGLSAAEEAELKRRAGRNPLYGTLLPVEEFAQDEGLRARFPFLDRYHRRDFALSDDELKRLGLPPGIGDFARICQRHDMESTYPTLTNTEDTEGSRTGGIMPASIMSGTREAQALLLSIVGNKERGIEPHPWLRMVGYDWQKKEETVYPKTIILPTRCAFHHAGQMGPADQRSKELSPTAIVPGTIPVVLNSEPLTIDELVHEDGSPYTPEEKAARVTEEQHIRRVSWAEAIERLLGFGDPDKPALFISLGGTRSVVRFTQSVVNGRAIVLDAEDKDGFAALTTRRPPKVSVLSAPAADRALYQPVLPQVMAGIPMVEGGYLGPIGYLSNIRLGVDSERRDLIARIQAAVDFSDPALPRLRTDPFLTSMGATGPFGMAAMTGPGTSRLVGAVARADRTAFLAAGNYPPQGHLDISARQAFLTGLVDTAWETTRREGADGVLNDGDLTFEGGTVVRGTVETYATRAQTDARFEQGGHFTGSMKPFGVNIMHGLHGFSVPQVDATATAMDLGIPIDGITLGIYLVSDVRELNRYIPLIAQGVRFIPLLANLKAIEEYEKVHIPHLQAELKKYLAGGWKTFDQENRAPNGAPLFRDPKIHARIAERHARYFGEGGFDRFMADHPHIFGEAREGNDGGGHNNPEGTPTYRLVQHYAGLEPKDRVPNLMTGGYADGLAIADARLAGAAGVQSGSAYEIAEEADLPDSVKALLMEVADPAGDRGTLFITSEFGKPIKVADNAFSRAYVDLIATNDAEEILEILAREPAASVRVHKEFWDRGIDSEDPALGPIPEHPEVFDPIWDYLLGDRTSGRAEAIAAIRDLVAQDEGRCRAAHAKRFKGAADAPAFNPVADNDKRQIITYFRVFRTNMIQTGQVDPEWAYVLVGPSVGHIPEEFVRRYRESGVLPTVRELIDAVEGQALGFLSTLYLKALQVEQGRRDAYTLRNFDYVKGARVDRGPAAGGDGEVVRVRFADEVDTEGFRKACRAQGYGALAHVVRAEAIFNRFFSPRAGREYFFELTPAADGQRGPLLTHVRVAQDGREIARLRQVSERAVEMSYDVPLDPYRSGEPGRITYHYDLQEPAEGITTWVLDSGRVQTEAQALFGRLLTGETIDYTGRTVEEGYADTRTADAEHTAAYNRICGEGYGCFAGSVHPAYLGTESLRAAVYASNHPAFRGNRFELLHSYFNQVFGDTEPAVGAEIAVEAHNLKAGALKKGGFSQDIRIVSRVGDEVATEVDTGFVVLDPKGSFTPVSRELPHALSDDNSQPGFKGFNEFPVFQALTKITGQDITDYCEYFDPNAIHDDDFTAEMAGLEKGIIAQGMLCHGKMVSHMIGGYLKGNRRRARSVRTTFVGTVRPGEDLDLVAYKIGQQGDVDILRFDAVNADGKVVVSQEWRVIRRPQIVAFPGQGFQKAKMWEAVTGRYRTPAGANAELTAAYERAQKAQRDFLKEVDHTSEALWGFRLSTVVNHNPKVFSFTVREEYQGSYRGAQVGERVTIRNAKGLLSETDFAQPALFVAYMLDYIGLQALGRIHPDADIVYNSLGKIPALVASGAVDVMTGLKIARARGVYMGQVRGAFGVASGKVRGLWDIIDREATRIRERLGADYGVWATNQNSSQQFGFAGTELGVKALVARLESLGVEGLKAKQLEVIENPFHTPLYDEAAGRFEDYLGRIEFNEGALRRLILNSTGKRFDPATDNICQALARHIKGPIHVSDGFETAAKAHPDAELVELGHVEELSKRAGETLGDAGLFKGGRLVSAATGFAGLTFAEAPAGEVIEVKLRAVKAVAPAASAAAPVTATAAPLAVPAAPAQTPTTGSGVAGKYLEPVTPGDADHENVTADVRVATAGLLTAVPNAYSDVRRGLIPPDDEGLIKSAVARTLVPLGPGALEAVQAELKHRTDNKANFSGADALVQAYIINVLTEAIAQLTALRKKYNESKRGAGAGVDMDSPEFERGVLKVVAKGADDIGLVRVARDRLRDHKRYTAEVGPDGTLYKPGGQAAAEAQSRLQSHDRNLTARYSRMLETDYRGIRFYMNNVQHNGAETNLFNWAAALKAAEAAGTLGELDAKRAAKRRRLANQLDNDGARRAEALADLYEHDGSSEAAKELRAIAAETRESLRVGGLPPLHEFDMTRFEALYGTDVVAREVTRGMSPTEAVKYLKDNNLIQPELADRIQKLIDGKVSLKGERALILGAGTITAPLISFLLEHGAEVVVTTTRNRGQVDEHFHNLFQEYAARGARLEVKTEMAFNTTNYVKLVDELRLDGFAPTLFVNGAGVGDYEPFASVAQEDWSSVSETLVRASLYIKRLLAKWYLQEQIGVTCTDVDLASPAAIRPLPNSASYRAAKNALDAEGWLDHVVETEGLKYADGTPIFREKQLVVGWVNPEEGVRDALMGAMRDVSGNLETRIHNLLQIVLHTFNGPTMASGIMALLDPEYRNQSERLGALGNFDHPQLEGGVLAREVKAELAEAAKKHEQARADNGGKAVDLVTALRKAGKGEEADRIAAAAARRRQLADAHPFQHGLVYRVWDQSFYVRDEALRIDTFDPRRHVEAKDDDLVAVSIAATGPYGKTAIGNYRAPLDRWGVLGEWDGADWQDLIAGMADIPKDLTNEEYATGKAPDGKLWRDKIYAQAGLRRLESLVRRRRHEATTLGEDAWVPVAAANKDLIRRHTEAGHEIIVEEGYDIETGEYITVAFARVPKGEDLLTWVVDSLGVTTLADLAGGSDSFFQSLTGVPPAELALKSYATVLSRLDVSQMLRMLGMNSREIRDEITAAAINVVAGIGMVDFNPTDHMMTAARTSATTEKQAIIDAIPNAVGKPGTSQLGGADSKKSVNAACATGPAALKDVEDQYKAARADLNEAVAQYAAGTLPTWRLFRALQEYYLKAYFTWSVDHANVPANVQAFDSLGDRGAMARDDFLAANGLPPLLALMSHNEYRDGFLAGVMIGGMTLFPRLLAELLGAKTIARMIAVTGSTDFDPRISGEKLARQETAPGVEGQVLALTRLIERVLAAGYTLSDIVAWFTHSTGTMGDDKQSLALRLALELAEAAEPGLAIENFLKQIFAHGLGATMFEQVLALIFLHHGWTLGQPSLSRTIAETAENPYMFPSRRPLDVFAALGRSPRRGAAGTNFGFHGENRAWAFFVDTQGYNSVRRAITSIERAVLNEAQSIADYHANRNKGKDGARQDDILFYDATHAPVDSHPHAKFMTAHARTIALMMVEREMTGRQFDFDLHLENEVLAYEARLFGETGEGRVGLAHRRALTAMGGTAYAVPDERIVATHRRSQEMATERVERAYRAWGGDGFTQVAQRLGVDQGFVGEWLERYDRLMETLGRGEIPDITDWPAYVKRYLIDIGAPGAAAFLARTIAQLKRERGDNPAAEQAIALWVFQQAMRGEVGEIDWSSARGAWRKGAA